MLHFCSGLPIILVGCKKDLRFDAKTIEELHKTSQKPVSPEQVSASANSPSRNHFLTSPRARRCARESAPLDTLNARPRRERACARCLKLPRAPPSPSRDGCPDVTGGERGSLATFSEGHAGPIECQNSTTRTTTLLAALLPPYPSRIFAFNLFVPPLSSSSSFHPFLPSQISASDVVDRSWKRSLILYKEF